MWVSAILVLRSLSCVLFNLQIVDLQMPCLIQLRKFVLEGDLLIYRKWWTPNFSLLPWSVICREYK